MPRVLKNKNRKKLILSYYYVFIGTIYLSHIISGSCTSSLMLTAARQCIFNVVSFFET